MADEPIRPDEQPGEKPKTDADKEAERAAKIAAAKAKAEAAKAARAAAEAAKPGDAPKSAEPGAKSDVPPPEAEKPKPKPPPKKEAVQTTFPLTDDPFIDAVKARFPDGVREALLINKQQVLRVSLESVYDVLKHLKESTDPDFDFLTDLTATHYPERGFEIVYQLFALNEARRLRVKVDLPDGVPIRSVVELWPTAEWLEREVYDLFGVRFLAHPDLRRILLPPDWIGHPLRKEHKLEFEENEWTAKHLNMLEISEDADLTGKFE